jgi:hypothetical protein
MSVVLEGLQGQRVIEMRNVAGLKSLVENAPSDIFSVVLDIIVHDSRKHMAICDALIRIESKESSKPPDLFMVSELREALAKHIGLEKNMLKRLEGLRLVTGDISKGLIEYMLADERRHHGLLLGLSELLDRGEDTLEKYDDLVDALLREAHQPGITKN